ncbi:preprotein translocase subunit YajC [bacterium]|nr:preprotein translocase subunit YajC [bacterium]
MILKFALITLLLGQAPPQADPGKTQPPAAQVQSGSATQSQPQAEPQKTTQPQAGQQQQGQQKPGSPWLTWVLLLGILVVFYLIMFIPQRRRQKKHKEMLNALQRGDMVMTSSGIHGTIVKVKEETIIIKSGDKTELEIDKSAISGKK